MVWFNGRGYAELRRSRLRPADRRQFSIAFTFRTRDENALLFSAVDVANVSSSCFITDQYSSGIIAFASSIH